MLNVKMGSSSSIWFDDASLWSRVGERRLRNNVNGAASRFGLTSDCERVVVLWLLIGRDQCGIAYITKQVPRSSLSECVALAKKWFRFTGFSSEQLLRQVVQISGLPASLLIHLSDRLEQISGLPASRWGLTFDSTRLVSLAFGAAQVARLIRGWTEVGI